MSLVESERIIMQATSQVVGNKFLYIANSVNICYPLYRNKQGDTSMKNLIRHSRGLLPKSSFVKRLGCILLLLLIIIGPLTIYLASNQGGLGQLVNNGIKLFPHNAPGQSLTLPPQNSQGSGHGTPGSQKVPNTANGCGVTQNPDGSYTFSWLHVANGKIVDANNCVVHLIGLNMGGLFLGSAGHAPFSAISWFKQHIAMNVVREAYNAYWWNTDVYVPDVRMHFRQWLETVVKWQEQQGNYVILDNATQFHNPPCGDDGMGYHVSLCPSQNQAQKNNPPNPQEKSSYQPTALAALASLAQLYANDPAIIFDVWNEPGNADLQGISEQTYFQDMNVRINTVRQYAPRSLIMVYNHDQPDIESGHFPNFSQPNIIWDTHIYDPNWNPSQGASKNVSFAQAHNQGFIIGEWGGQYGQPSPNTIIPFIQANALGSTYFDADMLTNGGWKHPTSLNSLGQHVAAEYATIFESQ